MKFNKITLAVGIAALTSTVNAQTVSLSYLPALPVAAIFDGVLQSTPESGGSIGTSLGRSPTIEIYSPIARAYNQRLRKEIADLISLLPARYNPIEPQAWEMGMGELSSNRLLYQRVDSLIQNIDYGSIGALNKSVQAPKSEIDEAIGELTKVDASLNGVPSSVLRNAVVEIQAHRAFHNLISSDKDKQQVTISGRFPSVPITIQLGDTYARPTLAEGVCRSYEELITYLLKNLPDTGAVRKYLSNSAALLKKTENDPTIADAVLKQWDSDCSGYEALAKTNGEFKELADASVTTINDSDPSKALEVILAKSNLNDTTKNGFRSMQYRLRSQSSVLVRNGLMRAIRPRIKFDGVLFKLSERQPDYISEKWPKDISQARADINREINPPVTLTERFERELYFADRSVMLDTLDALRDYEGDKLISVIGTTDAAIFERGKQARDLIYDQVAEQLMALRILREESVLTHGSGATEPPFLGIVNSVMKKKGEYVRAGGTILTFSPSMGRKIHWTDSNRPEIGASYRVSATGSGAIPLLPAIDKKISPDVRNEVNAFLAKAFDRIIKTRAFKCTVLSWNRTSTGYEIEGVIEDDVGDLIDITELSNTSKNMGSASAELERIGHIIRNGSRRFLLLLAGSLPAKGQLNLTIAN